MKDIRTRQGLHWQMISKAAHTKGFTPDRGNIATKNLAEANGRSEYIFIGIREIIEQNESYCLDNETERLTLCNEISNWVRQNLQEIQRSQ
tara:strand:- start:2161 stop:2433 length:273 start_codon:yes stop_codon:yes gene_type:complete